MKRCPETPAGSDVEFSGHVWVQELPTGAEFRFQVAASGLVTVATASQSYETAASVPPQYRRAADCIDQRLDRKALEAATDDPSDVTFCGIATRNEGIEFDWQRLPAFVGVDVWSGRQDRFLPPDSATGVFERLGLPTLPAIDKEVPAAHIDVTQYTEGSEFPQSEWRDGHAAGVLIRDKSGGRAVARCDDGRSQSAPDARTAAVLAEEYATDDRIERAAAALRTDGHSVTVEGVRDRLVSDVARESYVDLFSGGEFVASLAAFQSAVAERVQKSLSDGNR
ncbi:hypothetical protein ACFQGE_16985 [Halomicroarcula sp. GCM10025817]|uniref:hypothetical protein n=1 Tax=Haloarcula TaxID=2237 RepID=UPI0023E7EA36|nr:hypothetical protein [Halomicroarcula sp. SYNS111]